MYYVLQWSQAINKCDTSFGIVKSALVVCDSIGLVKGNDYSKTFPPYPWVIKMIVFDWSIIMIHNAWLRWWCLHSLSLYLDCSLFHTYRVACVAEHIYNIEWMGKWYTLFSLSFKLKLFLNFQLKKLLETQYFPCFMSKISMKRKDLG